MSLLSKRNNSFLPGFKSSISSFFNDNWMSEFPLSQVPPANISETDESYNLEIMAPGKRREDFNIEVDNGVLKISLEEETSSETNEKPYTRKEYSYSSFDRAFVLPENVKDIEIEAQYKEGVLHIFLPKKEIENSAKRQINVA